MSYRSGRRRSGPKPKYKVCPKCDGEGMVVNPALRVWTQDEPMSVGGISATRARYYQTGRRTYRAGLASG